MSTHTAPVGIKLILDALNDRRSLVDEVNFLGRFRNTARHQVFRDAWRALIDTYCVARSQGMFTRAVMADPAQAAFLAHSRDHMILMIGEADDRNEPELDQMLCYLVGALDAYAPHMTSVRYVAPPPATREPLPVQIVGQPSTTSVQTVERDSQDEITRTLTITQPVT
jgi:hypothetical protein